MTIRIGTLPDNDTLRFAMPASTAIAKGNLLWNNSGVAATASARADKGALAANQIDFAALFLGVMLDQRLVGETSTGATADRVIGLDVIGDCDCASATWAVGDLVGIDRNTVTPANFDAQVIKVAHPDLAIGVCLTAGSALTTVRARLTSPLAWARFAKNRSLAGYGTKAIPDAAYQVLLDDPEVLIQVPTTGRNVTMPNEAQAAAMNRQWTVVNNSAGGNSITLKGSAGSNVLGNPTVAQNKIARLYSDGTSWYAMVGA